MPPPQKQRAVLYLYDEQPGSLETLRRSEHALRARGVRRAALFGSVARGENRPGSDIDIMVEIDPEAHITVFDYVASRNTSRACSTALSMS
jgi:predicted nucleotidyltransferase